MDFAIRLINLVAQLLSQSKMNFLRLSYCFLVLLGVGGDCRLDTQLGGEVTTSVKSNNDLVRNLRVGPAASAAAPVENRRDLLSIVSGNTADAISPTDNPDSECFDEYGISYCVNGCPSLWYAVKGTGLSMTASSCVGGASYDQRIIVWGGTSCSDRSCIGMWKKWFASVSSCNSLSLRSLAFVHSIRQQ